MPPVALPATPAAAPAPAGPIIAAVTRRERDLFLTPALNGAAAVPPLHFVADEELTPAGWTERLDQWQPTVLITAWTTPPLPEAWLARAECPLRYVCHITGTVRQLVPRRFLERGGIVSNWGAHISDQVAEHGLLLALAALRNQAAWPAYIARPTDRRQINELETRSLFGRRVGLHGFGSVARALLPLLKPFGVTIAGYSSGVPAEFMRAHGVEPATSLAELCAQSEVLFECESLLPATARVVNAAVLAALPDGAVFVNIGRGGLVDEAALLHEVRQGRLRVALDVVDDEPVTPASPFLRSGAVTLSPHIGGPTRDRYPDCGALALRNLHAFLAGAVPETALSLAAYDRAT